jgi:hypothetical protein
MAERSRRARAERRPATTALIESWRRLNFEQRAAAVGALLLVVSTFGPFSFVEAALVLVAGGVLYLLQQRADGRSFHLPFGDGTIIFVAGLWSGLLILVRLFDRPLGQGLLALVCAAILVLAGARERSKRPPDDIPPDVRPGPTLAKRRPITRRHPSRPAAGPATPTAADTAPLTQATVTEEAPTERLPGAEPVPEPEGPPEFEPPPGPVPAAEEPRRHDAPPAAPPPATEAARDEDAREG